MKKNMSDADRIIRSLLGVAAVAVAVFVTTGWVDILLYVFAGVMFITALIGVCPLYLLFKISTRK